MFNWRELPLVRLLLPLASGILLSVYFPFDIPGASWFVASLALCLLVLHRFRASFRFRWLFGALLSFFLLGLGYELTWWRNELNRPSHFSRLPPTEERFFIGEVREAPVRKEDWIKIELHTRSAGNAAGHLSTCTGNILLYVERDSTSERIAYGDLLAFHGKATEVEPPKNPNAFDYRQYLHFQNIHHQCFVREDDWQTLGHGGGNPFYRFAILCRDRFIEILRKHLPGEREFSVGAALIIGYRDEVPEEVLTAYSETGAMHLLAVSGMHVGFIFLLVHFFLKKIKWNNLAWKVGKALIALTAIWSFALITGASPSVLRATVMFSFIIIGAAMRWHNYIYNTMAASAFCLLIFNPYLLFSVSFQLSYLAVLGIVYFEPKLTKLWVIKNRFGHYFWQLNNVSVGAQLMTLPLTLFYFHQFPMYFWLSSLLLVPVSGLVLGGGLVLFLLEMVAPGLAAWFGAGLHGLIWLSNEVIFFIQHLPLAAITGISISAGVSLLLFLSLASSMVSVSMKKFGWLLASLALLLLISLNYAFVTYRHFDHRQVVVYHIYKQTAIDCLDGNKAYSLVGRDLGKKALTFAAEGHRFALGIEEVQSFLLEDLSAHHSEQWFFQNGLLQFYDIRFAIVGQTVKPIGSDKIKVDYVVVRGSPKLSMEDLTTAFDFRQVIFDASNKKWRVEKWIQECEASDIDFYDIAEQGAFVVNLRQKTKPLNSVPPN